MDKKILTALQGSIEKWEKIVAGTGTDDGWRNCPLCEDFYKKCDVQICDGCPVHEKTGGFGCMKTPYEKWDTHQYKIHDSHFPYEIECKICERHAKAEVEFLKSLLPEKQ